MGYAAEKKEAERKWRRWKGILFLVGLVLVLAAAIVAIVIPPATWKYRVGLPDIEERKNDELRIHFIDVGQGDATLIELPDGKIALIDGGDGLEQSDTAIMRLLYALDVDTIDYLFLTHADEDHCGSLDVVLEYMQVKRAYIPLASQTGNEQYAQFRVALAQEEKEYGCNVTHLKNDIDVSGDGYTFTCLYPSKREVEDRLSKSGDFDDESNEYSAVLFLEYKGVSALFTGDLPMEQEEKLKDLSDAGLLGVDLTDTEILKAGHHGSKYSTGETLLALLHAETAVISCGANAYGHPHEEVLERLRAAGVETYRTDEQGNVIVSIQTGGYTVTALG